MNRHSARRIASLALLSAGVAMGAPVLAQEEQARELSSTPMQAADGSISHSVTYEYAGRQYTTRMPTPPGASIAVQVTPLGLATTAEAPAFTPPGPIQAAPADGGPAPWRNVTPEPGVVISSDPSGTGSIPAPPPPAAAYPAPVYVAPSYPSYPSYYYPYPQAYWAWPPGLSINLGYTYSRGWRGGRWR